MVRAAWRAWWLAGTRCIATTKGTRCVASAIHGVFGGGAAATAGAALVTGSRRQQLGHHRRGGGDQRHAVVLGDAVHAEQARVAF